MVDLSRNVLDLLWIMGFFVDKVLLMLAEGTFRNYHWTWGLLFIQAFFCEKDKGNKHMLYLPCGVG